MLDSQLRERGLESLLLLFRSWGIFILFTTFSKFGCRNTYLAIEGGGNMSE